MGQSDLRKRIREYEDAYRTVLPRRLPLIIRVDGKSFHTLCRGMERPWDPILKHAMDTAAMALCMGIQGAKVAYTQSDEITILATDYDDIGTQSWFGKNLQKMCSTAASIASVTFTEALRFEGELLREGPYNRLATFDARCFIVPRHEVCNVFIDRQQDCVRNSIQMLGQSHFSHKELQGLSNNEIQEKLFQEREINWNDCKIWQKRGRCVARKLSMDFGYPGEGKIMVTPRRHWTIDSEPPTFTQDRLYIERFVWPEKDSKEEE